MNLTHYILLLFIIVIYPNQKSSSEIQQEIDSRNNQIQLLKKEISIVEKNIINKTKNEIETSEILIDIQNKINLTEKLIASMIREEKSIQRKIDKSQIEIYNLENLIEKIQNTLKTNSIYAYKKGTPDFLQSIISIHDYADLAYKTKYLKVINQFQEKNKLELKKSILDLKTEKINLRKKLKDKKELKKNKRIEKSELEKDKVKKNKLLKKLNADKKEQEKNLATKRKSLENIESIINKLYTDKKSREKRENELAEIRRIQKMNTNGNFNSMKGKLPWPISGSIVSKFGNKKNEKLKTITENLGIDIKAHKNKNVITILDGVVSTITYIRGHGNIIIIDHGDGFNTVYSNVVNIQVNENDYIPAGKEIAQVDNNMILHFEVWGNQKKMNPEKWLIK